MVKFLTFNTPTIVKLSSFSPSWTTKMPSSSVSSPTPEPPAGDKKDIAPSHEALGYIFLSLAAVAMLVITMAMVLLLLRKRRLDRIRHRLMPLYNFDTSEEEHEDWEAELLEDSSDSHKLKRGYKSMEFPSLQS